MYLSYRQLTTFLLSDARRLPCLCSTIIFRLKFVSIKFCNKMVIFNIRCGVQFVFSFFPFFSSSSWFNLIFDSKPTISYSHTPTFKPTATVYGIRMIFARSVHEDLFGLYIETSPRWFFLFFWRGGGGGLL